MASSPEASDVEDIETPAGQITSSSILSPPDSQHRSTSQMPTPAPGAASANENGKRPLTNISNGVEEDVIDLTSEPTSGPGANAGKARIGQDFPPKTHRQSGYTWNTFEDEPGYAWLNKKALDERQRAWDSVVHKDCMIKGGFPLCMC